MLRLKTLKIQIFRRWGIISRCSSKHIHSVDPKSIKSLKLYFGWFQMPLRVIIIKKKLKKRSSFQMYPGLEHFFYTDIHKNEKKGPLDNLLLVFTCPIKAIRWRYEASTNLYIWQCLLPTTSLNFTFRCKSQKCPTLNLYIFKFEIKQLLLEVKWLIFLMWNIQTPNSILQLFHFGD